ncbi:CobW family GTP-binding protein [Streptomyces radicis]|uniref:Cobalamin biosynthesis protein CobW n=1 Tax=Streptomyces radicis TaxID=1750517 RepID=A0A3A9WKV0_9ACTN|nr:GTP-binding protein [Streptomyces radicis]RKN10084.1 cobalamin biosynthesis protein CobW [Streptomyces radicis]RKN24426.1 cobalamin biosynthesis protein CobW [Streptomyces radicis]
MGPTGSSAALPVVLVGGLHADARGAAVDRLLRALPGSVALHHDLSGAARHTVTSTVRDMDAVLGSRTTPLVNDCACCALRADLVPELLRLADGGVCALAVVELWDSVEPRSMAEVIIAHGDGRLRLSGVVTAVDPGLVGAYLGCGDDLADGGLAIAATDRRTVADTWARQLEYATVLALADVEDGGLPGDEQDRALLAQLHPTAHRVPIGSGAFPRLALGGFDVVDAAARQHPASALLPQEAQEHDVGTLVWRHRRPFHPARLYAALEELTCAAPRSRGRFWLANRPDTLLSWDAAGGALCVDNAGPWLAALPDAAWEMVPPVRRAAAALDWDPVHGDRAQHLVFTGPGLDRGALRGVLASCLLTGSEYAAGRAAWRRLASAFDELLDPVP